ncbi:ATP-binding protein [Actinoplanes awajinensis]|uniref:ATP-binding protein n=1 Tax=Actinoplanes awajinensis subsp. mycoplanecinus TaxID=135947 RepID=A0A101JQK1_9ACTN|nr:ATP-binding protein [Actinoplanes awajinensis]KUL31259.1 hypothetical protein ADL15_22685 [Actinoplanes awajinensis subsp. mycoplanecinus]
MLALFPSMKYKAWYALGELVDNAIQSYRANKDALQSLYPAFRLRIEIQVVNDSIIVRDNAAGIRAADIPRAFAPAQPPPDRTGLSQFGIGMKSAACWYARKFTVQTSALGESTQRVVEIDIPKILETRSDEVRVEVFPADPRTHGTIVTLHHLNQPTPTGRTLGKIRSYLGSIYRSFLRSGEIELIVHNEALAYREPTILAAPRWDTPKGPVEVWKKDIDVLLGSGRQITGWVAIREKGSTIEAGLSLLYRGKVVVGAGSMAKDTEGSYRPDSIFGRSNSFAYQRIFGELDVSELGVAYSKDDVIWGGDEDAFIESLHDALDAEPLPLLRMANGFRKSEHGREEIDVEAEVQRAVNASASAAAQSLTAPSQRDDIARLDLPMQRAVSNGNEPDRPISAEIVIPQSFGVSARFEVVNEPFDTSLIRIVREDGTEVIRVNRAAPFMRSFASLPDGDIEPILRLCLAVALAEIQARNAPQGRASTLRTALNKLLEGPLSQRIPTAL